MQWQSETCYNYKPMLIFLLFPENKISALVLNCKQKYSNIVDII